MPPGFRYKNQMVNVSLLKKSGNFFSDQGFSGKANFLSVSDKTPLSLALLCAASLWKVKDRHTVYSQSSFREAPQSRFQMREHLPGGVKSFLP